MAKKGDTKKSEKKGDGKGSPKKVSKALATIEKKTELSAMEGAVDVAVATGLRPSLSYLHGYPVVRATPSIVTFENGAEMTILDEDGLEIGFHDKLPGLTLITTIMSSTETVLIFGTLKTIQGGTVVENEVRLYLPPGHYSLADPRFNG